MRRVALLLAAAALSACSVGLEGAACSAAGDTAECPDGQRCGLDLKCSTRAADPGCALCPENATRCSGGAQSDVQHCSLATDPVCGAWTLLTACTPGVTSCGEKVAGGHDCECLDFVVHPDGATSALPCHYAAATGAVASAVADGSAWVLSSVKLSGSPTPATYGTGGAGLVIPAGMTVAGDDASPTPANRLLIVSGPAASVGVTVDGRGVLAGVRIERAAGGPLTAVQVASTAPGGFIPLSAVEVLSTDAGHAFTTGVQVVGGGAVTLDTVKVTGVTGVASTGLLVARDGLTDAVTATGLQLDKNGVGVLLSKGDLTLLDPTIMRSANEGISASVGAVGTARLTVRGSVAGGAVVARGSSVGVSVSKLDRLVMQNVRVCANGGRSQPVPGGTSRTVGGFVALGNAPAELTFSGNLVHDNGGDQMLLAAGNAWRIDAALCTDGTHNTLAGYSSGVGLAAIGTDLVKATFVTWKTNGLPTALTDYVDNITVDAVGTSQVDYCLTDAAALTCPP